MGGLGRASKYMLITKARAQFCCRKENRIYKGNAIKVRLMICAWFRQTLVQMMEH
jgi:hypothetical protein